MTNQFLIFIFFGLLAFCVHTYASEEKVAEANQKITYADTIRPILEKRCTRCHSGKLFFLGGLRLDSLKSIRKGGHSGPSVVAGNPKKSVLYQYIISGRMPPKGEERMPLDEVELIKKWIELGAK